MLVQLRRAALQIKLFKYGLSDLPQHAPVALLPLASAPAPAAAAASPAAAAQLAAPIVPDLPIRVMAASSPDFDRCVAEGRGGSSCAALCIETSRPFPF